MPSLTAYTPEDIAEAFLRLGEFASSATTKINQDTYPKALGDVAIALAFAQAFKAMLDSCPIPCTIVFDATHHELTVKRESP